MIAHAKKSSLMGLGRGMTLVELLMTLSVLAILLAVGVPSLGQFTTNNRLSNFSNSFFSNLSVARSEAIKRNGRVVICKSADGSACSSTGNWNQGWIIFSDLDNNASKGGSEQIIHKLPAITSGYNLIGDSSISNYVSFDSQGMAKLTGGNFQAGTFELCPPAPAVAGNGRQIILSGSGRARVIKITTCS